MNRLHWPRIARMASAALAIVVLAVVVSARAWAEESRVPSATRSVRPTEQPPRPMELQDDRGSLLAYPPHASTRTPITVVYLHGIQGRPEQGCPWFRDGAGGVGWLVCPPANGKLRNGTFAWAGSIEDKYAVVARAEHAAVAAGAAESTNVIVGFSQGAYVALDLVRARLGHYRGLVLIGAEANISKAMLEAAGVSRLVLAAGRFDATFGPLARAAARLDNEGMDVRFVDLGRIGHSYETTERAALRDAIAWVGGR